MLFQYFRQPSVAACYCISWFVSDMRSNPVFLKRDLRVAFFPLHFPELQICPGCFLDKKRPDFFCSLSFLTRSKSSVLRRSWSSSTTAPSEGPVKLHEGSQVLLTSSNEMGTIRYIGPTDFAPGIWLGLELRSAKGKNAGRGSFLPAGRRRISAPSFLARLSSPRTEGEDQVWSLSETGQQRHLENRL